MLVRESAPADKETASSRSKRIFFMIESYCLERHGVVLRKSETSRLNLHR
jgi:hypothetical protein